MGIVTDRILKRKNEEIEMKIAEIRAQAILDVSDEEKLSEISAMESELSLLEGTVATKREELDSAKAELDPSKTEEISEEEEDGEEDVTVAI